MIIGITGTNGSGKDTVAELIMSQFPNWQHYSLSDEIKRVVASRGLEINRDNLREVGNELRQSFGNAYLSQQILNQSQGDNIIVTSIRHPQEIEPFQATGNFVLVAVNAPIELRYERAIKRGRNDEQTISLEEFENKEQQELWGEGSGQQLGKLLEMADVNIENSGTMEELENQVTELTHNIETGHEPSLPNLR